MEKEFKKLLEEIDKLKLEVNNLKEEVNNLKKGSLGTGVYLDGAPDYVKEYIQKEGEK